MPRQGGCFSFHPDTAFSLIRVQSPSGSFDLIARLPTNNELTHVCALPHAVSARDMPAVHRSSRLQDSPHHQARWILGSWCFRGCDSHTTNRAPERQGAGKGGGGAAQPRVLRNAVWRVEQVTLPCHLRLETHLYKAVSFTIGSRALTTVS